MSNPEPHSEWDEVFVSSLHEAKWILAAWAVCFVWTLGVSYTLGYDRAETIGQEVAMIWGIPAWVMLGIVIPWSAASIFSIWFALFYMRDLPLGEENENEDAVVAEKRLKADAATKRLDEDRPGATS
jgi:hypothetical protein